MTMNAFEIVDKIIEPALPGAAKTLRALTGAEERIREQRYQRDKETAELSKARQSAADGLLARIDDAVRAIDEERDKKLKAIAAEEAHKRDLPLRGFGDTHDEYNGKLLKRAIAESQRVYDATMTAADVQVLAAISDPAAIETLLDEAMSSRSPESIARIAMVAESRVATLAARESRRGGGDIGPAFRAQVNVQNKLQQWRRKIASQTPEARREAVRGEHAIRVAQVRSASQDAARLFRIDQVFARAGSVASAQANSR